MKPIPLGHRYGYAIETRYKHTAAALGNEGVTVVSTPSLVAFLEMAAHRALEPFFDPGEGSVGTLVNVRHLGAAPEGAVVEAEAEVVKVERKQIEFAVRARWRDTLLMEGTHGRAVVDLARFFERLGLKRPA